MLERVKISRVPLHRIFPGMLLLFKLEMVSIFPSIPHNPHIIIIIIVTFITIIVARNSPPHLLASCLKKVIRAGHFHDACGMPQAHHLTCAYAHGKTLLSGRNLCPPVTLLLSCAEPSNPSTQPQPEEAEAKLLSGHSKKTSPLVAVFPSPSPTGSVKSATSPKNLAFAPPLPSPTGSIKGESKLRLSPSLGEGEKQEGEGETVNEQPAIAYPSPKGWVKGLPSLEGIVAMSAPFLQSPTGSLKGKWRSKKSETSGEGEAQEDEIVDETSKMPESFLKQRSMKQRRRGVTDDDGSLNLLGHDSFRIQGDHELHSPSRILPPTSPWGSERHEFSFGSRSLLPLENAHMSEGQIEEMIMVQEKDEALRRLFRGCVLENSAQKQVYARQKIMSDLSVSESTNWFNSPNPLVALFSRRQFVGYLAAICLFFLVCGGAGISEVSTDGRIRVHALRFTSLGRRDGGNVTTPGIARFGIIGDRGCILDFNFEGGVGEQEATVISSGPTITARFHKALEIGGYFIVTSDGPPELDSTLYRLDGLVEDHGGDESKEDWGVIGGSHWSRNAWGEVSNRPGSSHHTEARNAAVSYALSLTWPRMLLSVAQPFALVFGCFVTVSFSVTKRYHDACTAWIATSVVKTLFLIASAVGYILEGDMNSVKMLSVVAAIDVIMLFVSWLFPKFVIEVTFVSNLSATISWFAFEIFFPRPMRILASPLTTRYLSSQYVYAISSLVSSVTLLIIKERVVRMMSREFIEYTAQFSAAWSELMADMGEQGTLDDIKNLCNLMKLTSGSQTTLHQARCFLHLSFHHWCRQSFRFTCLVSQRRKAPNPKPNPFALPALCPKGEKASSLVRNALVTSRISFVSDKGGGGSKACHREEEQFGWSND